MRWRTCCRRPPQSIRRWCWTPGITFADSGPSSGRAFDSLAKIDTKAVFLIGFAGTVAQFLAAHRHEVRALRWWTARTSGWAVPT